MDHCWYEPRFPFTVIDCLTGGGRSEEHDHASRPQKRRRVSPHPQNDGSEHSFTQSFNSAFNHDFDAVYTQNNRDQHHTSSSAVSSRTSSPACPEQSLEMRQTRPHRCQGERDGVNIAGRRDSTREPVHALPPRKKRSGIRRLLDNQQPECDEQPSLKRPTTTPTRRSQRIADRLQQATTTAINLLAAAPWRKAKDRHQALSTWKKVGQR